MVIHRFLLAFILLTFFVTGNAHQMPEGDIPDNELLKDVSIEELQDIIASHQGKKAVLINIWATWCGPCVEEFPHIVKLQRKYKDELRVIFVSTDFKREAALAFLKEQGVDWTTYFSKDNGEGFINGISKEWTGAMPFTKIIDKQGNVVASWENSADFETFNKNVKKAITDDD